MQIRWKACNLCVHCLRLMWLRRRESAQMLSVEVNEQRTSITPCMVNIAISRTYHIRPHSSLTAAALSPLSQTLCEPAGKRQQHLTQIVSKPVEQVAISAASSPRVLTCAALSQSFRQITLKCQDLIDRLQAFAFFRVCIVSLLGLDCYYRLIAIMTYTASMFTYNGSLIGVLSG